MALISCTQCGQHVSDKAQSCMACGALVAEMRQPAPLVGSRVLVENPFPTRYDPQLIYASSHRLYQHALLLMVLASLLGGLTGWILGYSLDHTASIYRAGGETFWTWPLAVLGALLGFLSVQSMVFILKLVAQLALCFVQIEQNTRH